ncbi:hypothetical protein V6Z11_A09G222000 [Gossypium hirsutum]
MDSITIFFLCLLLTWFLFQALNSIRNERKSSKSKLPPGPWLKPIFGNLFDLGDKPHRSLATLAQIHGPVMTSQHHEYGLPWIPVSPLWRTLRKVCNIHLFTSMKLDANEYLRRHKIQELIAKVGENCLKVDLVDPNSSNAQEFKKIETVCDIMMEAGRPNLADYFPLLRKFDPQGVQRRMTVHSDKLLNLFGSMIDERLQSRKSRDLTTSNDVLDIFLDIIEGEELNKTHIQHLLLDLFVAGTDTTSSTLEWAMPELLRNPQALLKAKKELEEAIGKGNPVEESDINRLPYLDPSIWDNPNSFIPDRFLGSEIDVKGRDFGLIPFGAGRRICPGLPLANRMLHLMLGSLINYFDWKPEGEISPNEMNMEEKYRMAVHMATPLRAIPLLV